MQDKCSKTDLHPKFTVYFYMLKISCNTPRDIWTFTRHKFLCFYRAHWSIHFCEGLCLLSSYVVQQDLFRTHPLSPKSHSLVENQFVSYLPDCMISKIKGNISLNCHTMSWVCPMLPPFPAIMECVSHLPPP